MFFVLAKIRKYVYFCSRLVYAWILEIFLQYRIVNWELIMGTYKSLVYNFGSEAGFFSEFNNMVLALLYCEKNKVVFKLFSTGSKLSDDLWNDFFQPFCMQARNRLNARFNDRQPDFIPDNKIFKYGSALLRFMQNGYLTYDLWQRFRLPSFAKESFLIDGENLTLPDAGKAIINRIWIFNPQTKTEIQKRMNTVDLPSEYVGLHIRRGDKTTEIKNTGYSSYFSKLTSLTDCKNLFIATDDYSVVDDIALLYPQYSIFSMASSLDRGYDHSTFVSLDSIKKRESLLQLFTEIEILSAAKLTVGTFSSNIGMYLGMRMGSDRFFGVDFDNWRIW